MGYSQPEIPVYYLFVFLKALSMREIACSHCEFFLSYILTDQISTYRLVFPPQCANLEKFLTDTGHLQKALH